MYNSLQASNESRLVSSASLSDANDCDPKDRLMSKSVNGGGRYETDTEDAECSLFSHHFGGLVNLSKGETNLDWILNRLLALNHQPQHVGHANKDTLRRAIRKLGVPSELRDKVWLILIEQTIGADHYDTNKLLALAQRTIDTYQLQVTCKQAKYQCDGAEDKDDGSDDDEDEETRAILKQIELDVNRTMPGNKLFDGDAEGGTKLRRILVAYALHVNKSIGYCQGFNFIVALLLSLFDGDESKALSGFVCVVDHLFPSKYYFDHYLTGARADQLLLADFICDQLIRSPTSSERKMVEAVTSSITLNWFISLFHGALPSQTRLVVLDHFMLEGVKALFKFTMAILHLAFKATPVASCEIFSTIRRTAKDLHDVKLLLSVVAQIKLPRDSYFAIRRSFYMVQSSFNSDQFYLQTLAKETSRRQLEASRRPTTLHRRPKTRAPAVSSFDCNNSHGAATLTSSSGCIAPNSAIGTSRAAPQHQQKECSLFTVRGAIYSEAAALAAGAGPRVCVSADRTKLCLQSIGKLGRSYLKMLDSEMSSSERSLMSPLRHFLVIGLTNCGRNLIVARQASKRQYKRIFEQDLILHVYELCAEIFDGFFIEDMSLAIVLTHGGEVLRIDCSNCLANCAELISSGYFRAETLMLRDNYSSASSERIKLRSASLDRISRLIWIYVECEDTEGTMRIRKNIYLRENERLLNLHDQNYLKNLSSSIKIGCLHDLPKFKNNNPFATCAVSDDFPDHHSELSTDESSQHGTSSSDSSGRQSADQLIRRKVLLVDLVTFDLFSTFTVPSNFSDLVRMKTSLVAFCQLSNSTSGQFSSKIIQLGPTGRYEQLLSFSDVVDYNVSVPESFIVEMRRHEPCNNQDTIRNLTKRRYSSLKRLFKHPLLSSNNCDSNQNVRQLSAIDHSEPTIVRGTPSTLTPADHESTSGCSRDGLMRLVIASAELGDLTRLRNDNFIPSNMVFIFRSGKIALFEFTEAYTIRTRESQLDRYDYSKIIDVSRRGNDFVVTILTIFDKLIKVVI